MSWSPLSGVCLHGEQCGEILVEARAAGWRIDVADELPDEFLKQLRKVVKEENPTGPHRRGVG